MKIEDGKGSGLIAGVGINGVKVDAIVNSAQHTISHENNRAYQIDAEINIAATEKTILSLRNISAGKSIIVTYIRVMSVGAAPSSENSYFNVKVGGKRLSGGTIKKPINMKVGSPIEAAVDSYEGSGTDIVMDNSESQIDRYYGANVMQKYAKEGVLIADVDGTISITHKGSTVAGKAYCRISFYMD